MDFNKFKEYFEPGDWSKLQKEIKHRYDLIKNEGLPNSADYAELYLKNLANAENPYYFLLTATSMVKPITADGAYWYNVSNNLKKPKAPVNESFLKMQKLAGLITESQYKNKVNEMDEFDDDDGFDLTAAYDASPDTHSYEDMLAVASEYEGPGFDAAKSFQEFFPEGEEITKDAWEEWSRTLDGGHDPEGYVYLNWISLTDPDIYEKAGVA